MLPIFPEFKPIELNDRENIEAITAKFPPYSDFNFISMWSWDINGDMRISLLNGNLVVRFTDYLTNEPFYSFLGDSCVNETILTLLNFSKNEGLDVKLKLVPEVCLQQIDTTQFSFFEERDHFDYIYAIDAVHSYDGSKHKTHRQLVRFFEKNHSFESKMLDLKDEENRKQLLELVHLWITHKEQKVAISKNFKELDDFQNEYLALKKIFSAPHSLLETLVCSAVFVDGILSGFIIDEKISSDYCISHFGKTNIFHKGNLQFLMQKSIKNFFDLGLRYYNDEQDLGLLNLRSAKSSYSLAHFLKKYTVAITDNRNTI